MALNGQPSGVHMEMRAKEAVGMPHQLSLFPRDPSAEDAAEGWMGPANAVDEMFAGNRRFRSSLVYLELLGFIARFPGYSVFNGLLLYLQNPAATCVATAASWQKNYQRRIHEKARPLVILAPMSPVRFVYDINDTAGGPVPEKFPARPGTPDRLPREVYDRTLHNCTLHGIAVREIPPQNDRIPAAVSLTYDLRRQHEHLELDAHMNYLIRVDADQSLESRYADLTRQVGHIFCGHLGIDHQAWWPDRNAAAQHEAAIEAESVAFLVCRRKGLISRAKKLLAADTLDANHIPPISLHAVFQATAYIEEMARTRWKQPRKKSRYEV
jgi:hypothetical protein